MNGYEAYCVADSPFFEAPPARTLQDSDFAIARRAIPDGWARAVDRDWVGFHRPEAPLPQQGWKVHASACPDNAERVLDTVWSYCVARGIAFKFLRSGRALLLRNSKSADRAASGKFITIYPSDEAQLEAALTELGALLDGEPGPYILSDLRWGSGPLYVRYGGFAPRQVAGPDGQMEAAILDGSGRLVPDRREPGFAVPPWVELPRCLVPHLATRNSGALDDLRYEIVRPLHFSNGGGVYLARDRETGRQVVLKEARPHAGLDLLGLDAIARLRREREVLSRLAGLEGVAALRDYFVLEDHEFLVQDFVEGGTLNATFVDRYPLLGASREPRELAEHAAWAMRVCAQVEALVAEVHGRGIAIGDFSPANLLLQPDGQIVLIDWETAGPLAEQRQRTIGTPGFAPSPELPAVAADRYALACLRLHLLLPLTSLLPLDPKKAHQLAGTIAELFPTAAPFAWEAAEVIEGRPTGGRPASRPAALPGMDPPAWPGLRDALSTAILASATPDRDDRLFPGDVGQFVPAGGLGLAHGAAGVLYALQAAGAERFPQHEDWLVAHARKIEPGAPIGLYDGMHGIAYTLHQLGRQEDALALLDRCIASGVEALDGLTSDLHSGLAGIGLNLAHFAAVTGAPELARSAEAVAEVLARRLDQLDDGGTVSGGEHPYAGLMRGWSGPALLFLHLFADSGEQRLLDLAATALHRDLRRCAFLGGTLQVNEASRRLPYLAVGSVGIGMVLDRYLRHRHDVQFEEAVAAIDAAALAQFYIEPGLFQGRAGMILYLASRRFGSQAETDRAVIERHIRQLGWHAVAYREGTAFPGAQLLRLSMDLATGTAGVLLSLGAALHDRPVQLPFLRAPLTPAEAAD